MSEFILKKGLMGGEVLLDEHEVGCPGNWEEQRDCSPGAVWEVFPLCWKLNPSPSGLPSSTFPEVLHL